MPRAFRADLTRFLLLAVLFQYPAAGSGQQVFRGGSDAVRVFVTVTDRDGRLVTTLTRDNFEVRDDGKPQPLAQYDNSPQPIRLIVMLDVSGSMEGNLQLLRDAAAQLFSRLLPDDLARVGVFGNEVRISRSFTRNADELLAALPTAIAPDAQTPLWRALDDAIGGFDRTDGSRKVILVLSDGKDSGPIGFRQRPGSQAGVIDRARLEDVMIYAIGLRSRRARPAQPGLGPGGLQSMLLADLPDPGLARVAEETGGGYTEIRPGQDLGAAFAGVADELHTQYLLGFAPPRRDGKTHEIEVRINKGGLKPRARKSYVAPQAESGRGPDAGLAR
jgi:Ca-activated chloride channel family protein